MTIIFLEAALLKNTGILMGKKISYGLGSKLKVLKPLLGINAQAKQGKVVPVNIICENLSALNATADYMAVPIIHIVK